MNTSDPVVLAGIPNAVAQRWADLVARSKRPTLLGLRFHVAWGPSRRLVVHEVHPVFEEVPTPIHDYGNGDVTVACSTDPDYYVNALRSFSMRYSARLRALDRSMPADVVADFDGVLHRVPRWHHVAACGCKGPWVASDAEAGSVAVTCPDCVKKSRPIKLAPKPKASSRSR